MKSLSEYIRECRDTGCRDKKRVLRARREDIRRNRLGRPVKESVSRKRNRRMIKENANWCGVPGADAIWRGEWSDPEIRYKGYLLNEWDVQDEITRQYELENLSSEEFSEWLFTHSGEIKSVLDGMIAAGCGDPVKESRRNRRRPIKECVKPFKRTFPDDATQNRFNNDFVQMLSGLSDEKFMSKYFERRLRFDDPNSVDAIWQEYIKRYGKK